MRASCLLVGLLGVFVFGAPAPAQPLFYSGRSSVGYSRSGGHSHFSVYLRGSYGVGYAPSFVYGWPSSQVYVFYSPPPPSSVVVVMPPRNEIRDEDLEPVPPRRRLPREEPAPEREMMPPPPPAVPPGDPASVFRPIRPADRDQARQPVAPEPAPRRPLFPPEEPGLLRPPPPEADPKVEAARQITLGKEALTLGEYGRAASRFRRAAELKPQEPLALFLLAQADFALGRYGEAVEAVEAGLRLNPDWPRSGFRPRDLYGPEAGEFPDQLRRLEAAVERHPDDPNLAFLYGYELWFDGRQEEALPLFRRALNLAPDKAFIRRFLPGGPAGPVAAR